MYANIFNLLTYSFLEILLQELTKYYETSYLRNASHVFYEYGPIISRMYL